MLKDLTKGLVYGFGQMVSAITLAVPFCLWYNKRLKKELGLNED